MIPAPNLQAKPVANGVIAIYNVVNNFLKSFIDMVKF